MWTIDTFCQVISYCHGILFVWLKIQIKFLCQLDIFEISLKMGNAESAGGTKRRGGSGKLLGVPSSASPNKAPPQKEKRSRSAQFEQSPLDGGGEERAKQRMANCNSHLNHQCCCCCTRHHHNNHSHRNHVNNIYRNHHQQNHIQHQCPSSTKPHHRAPRRLAHKASEGDTTGTAAGTSRAPLAIYVPRMAEDTVAMTRTTVSSATTEERVALAAATTAVRWRDLNLNGAASLAAGAVLSVAVQQQFQQQQQRAGRHTGGGGKAPQRHSGGGAGGSWRSDRTAPGELMSNGSNGVGGVDRPAIGFSDLLPDNASLDEMTLSDQQNALSASAQNRHLGAALMRHRPSGASFDAIRRAKSFRHGRGPSCRGANAMESSGAVFKTRATAKAAQAVASSAELGTPCPCTGLTIGQKRLILARWRQLSWPDMLRLCEHIFDRTFRRNESFARIVLRMGGGGAMPEKSTEKSEKPTWKSHPAFRVHILRFCQALASLCAGLEDDPWPGAELLAEFGAQHAGQSQQNIPPSYWDVLLLAMCEAAGTTEGQNNAECFAPAGCSISTSQQPHSSLPSSSSGISSNGSSAVTTMVAPSPQQSPAANSASATMLLPQWTRRSGDAWAQFSVFVSAQMRFGYEMERFLRERMRKRLQGKQLAGRRRSVSASGSFGTPPPAHPLTEAEEAEAETASADDQTTETGSGNKPQQKKATTASPPHQQKKHRKQQQQQQQIEVVN